MPPQSATLSVLVGNDFACIKIGGRANFTCSPDFKTLLEELAGKNYRHFILDLAECQLMDSTFLGVLAGFGMKLNPGGPKLDAEKGIELYNPNERVSELLENLGALHLFHLKREPLKLPGAVQTCTPEASTPTHEELTRTSLEAHQNLMAVNPENIPRFKDVTQFLAEDLKSIEKCK